MTGEAVAKSAIAKRREGARYKAPRRAALNDRTKHREIGAQAQNLLLEGRAMDIADTMAGQHGSLCRASRALNAFFVRYLDVVDVNKVTHDQAMQIGELMVGLAGASTGMHDSLTASLPPADGDRPAIDAAPTSALVEVTEKFKQKGKGNG
jgi:hypothetical protein